MKFSSFGARTRRNRQRRKGVAMIYVTLLIPVLIGITAYCVDMSYLYQRKAQSQTAADAAALGGAWRHANFQSAQADDWARWYASLPENGGYVNGQKGVNIAIEYPAVDRSVSPAVTRYNWYRVTITKPEPTFFAGFFGSTFRSVNVKTTATALYETLAELDIKGSGDYGKAPGPVNLSVFGPDGWYNFGDCYSTKKINNSTLNPLYNSKGYDFSVNVDSFIGSRVHMQIFDPDCYNSGSGLLLDEYRTKTGNNGGVGDATTTKYSLYDDNDTPYNTADDILLKQDSFDGTDTATDSVWYEFANISKSSLRGNLRLNVTSTAGASENGFDLRVSDQAPLSRSSQLAGNDNFNKNNGSKITAQGHIPMNFNTDGTVTVNLGTVPVQAAGGQLNIRKFDTDVGAKSITYTCTTLPGQSWPGKLSGDGSFESDTISVPSNYNTAGIWKATYTAGTNDTSVWDMSFSNYGPGKPGGIKLIR